MYVQSFDDFSHVLSSSCVWKSLTLVSISLIVFSWKISFLIKDGCWKINKRKTKTETRVHLVVNCSLVSTVNIMKIFFENLRQTEQITNDIENYCFFVANENEKQISLSMLRTFYAWIDVKSSVQLSFGAWCELMMKWKFFLSESSWDFSYSHHFFLFILHSIHSVSESSRRVDDRRWTRGKKCCFQMTSERSFFFLLWEINFSISQTKNVLVFYFKKIEKNW